MGSSQKALLDKIDANGDYNEEIQQSLHAAIKDFKATNTW
jgi:F-type H+-transporting ATPase subunit alpha